MLYSKRKNNSLKILIIGDAGVGKTSLLKRYVTGKFSTQYRVTLGADFLSKKQEINGKEFTLNLWDTAGQEKHSSLGNAFYRGADCCVMVFDITSKKSLESLESWKEVFLDAGMIKNPDEFPFIILGNKCDRDSEREVSKEEAEAWCGEHGGYDYFEVSAKDGDGVENAFDRVTKHAADQQQEDEYVPPKVDLNETKKKKKNRGGSGKGGGCC